MCLFAFVPSVICSASPVRALDRGGGLQYMAYTAQFLAAFSVPPLPASVGLGPRLVGVHAERRNGLTKKWVDVRCVVGLGLYRNMLI